MKQFHRFVKRQEYNYLVDKVTNSQTASAYLVNKDYYTTLLNHYKAGYNKLKKTKRNTKEQKQKKISKHKEIKTNQQRKQKKQ